MGKAKDILTTGDVARICHVAPRTVSKWFDNGQLRGYRIPGSKDRRIPMSELIRFMKVHNMPTTDIPFGKIRVLLADNNRKTASLIAETLQQKAGYEVQIVDSNFEAGLAVQRFSPHVILVNLLSEEIDAADLCRGIRLNDDAKLVKVIALTTKLTESESISLLHKGFDGYAEYREEALEIIRSIEEVIALVY